jgi:predicted deacylase
MSFTVDDGRHDFAGLHVGRGQRGQKRIRVAELPDGSWVELPLMVIRGVRPGPIFYLGAAFHGDEVAGVEIVGRLVSRLDASSLGGTLLVVPVQNPLAFQVQHRYFVGHMLKSPMDQNPADPWASFPGDANGNLAALIAHALFDQLMRHAHYMIDIHTPTTGGRYAPFAFLPPTRCGSSVVEAEKLARAFGADYILANDKGMYVGDKNPHTILGERGVPAFGVEIGEGGRLEEADVSVGVRGLLNVLKQVGMIPGQPESLGRQVVIRTMEVTRASRGGLLHLHVGLNDDIDQGQHVASVISPFGEVLEQIHARRSGPVVRIATIPIVSSGERVIQVGVRR